ncbi:MAG: HAMP domain-containing protein [Nonomuraea sp.]|nr:HAMP domain-containing protein [Nonomuraea sp.]
MRHFGLRGLRGRMALSYVLVTAAAVLVVEALLLVVYLGPVMRGTDLSSMLQEQASADAKSLSLKITKLAAIDPDLPAPKLLGSAATTGGTMAYPASGVKVAVKDDGTLASGKVPIEGVLGTEGQVLSGPPPGLNVPLAGEQGGTGRTRAGVLVAWRLSPIMLQRVKDPGPQTVGYVYVQAPADYRVEGAAADLTSLLLPGALVLALAVPVGLVFGLLSTRRLTGRVRALAEVTTAVADGGDRAQELVPGRDEVGQLEDAVNRMSVAVEAGRLAARTEARQAERGRIARELHDSISQDLFSLSLLAAGMRRAAPRELREAAESMERTSARAMREMQALLLELRPVALEHAGLVPAIQELCHAYETRLGLRVTACLEPIPLSPAAEHAVLRLVQEALGNAVKHADPTRLEVRLARDGEVVTVEVSDDGPGFDPDGVTARHGMGLAAMRERVHELGGYLRVSAREGTTITATFPS